MEIKEIIDIIGMLIMLFSTIVTLVIAIKSLKKSEKNLELIKKMNYESNKGNIVISIDNVDGLGVFTLKNTGNTYVIIECIKITCSDDKINLTNENMIFNYGGYNKKYSEKLSKKPWLSWLENKKIESKERVQHYINLKNEFAKLIGEKTNIKIRYFDYENKINTYSYDIK